MKESLILIVDDQPDNLDTMIGYLRDTPNNYKFSQAVNGSMALKVAQKRTPNLIILDWEMPEMNGYDALVALKLDPQTKDIPVIMATGRSSGADLEKALNAGAADYIRKPIEKLELLARVRTCLSLSKYIKDLNEKNAELEAYDKMVSHDLKGPIGHVYSLAQFLHNDELDKLSEQGQQFLSQVLKSSKSSLALIDGILSFASADKPEELESEVNLQKLAEDAKEALSLKIKESKAEVTIDKLPIVNKAVSVKVYQLIYNLMGNALKFSRPGVAPVVAVYAQESDKEVEIVVQDNGIGFDQEQAEEIFKPLKRLQTEAKYEGYGIGLGTCKRIVDFHGWEIRAEGNPGVGAKFIIALN